MSFSFKEEKILEITQRRFWCKIVELNASLRLSYTDTRSVLPSIFCEVVIARIVRTGTHSLQ